MHPQEFALHDKYLDNYDNKGLELEMHVGRVVGNDILGIMFHYFSDIFNISRVVGLYTANF